MLNDDDLQKAFDEIHKDVYKAISSKAEYVRHNPEGFEAIAKYKGYRLKIKIQLLK